MKRRSLFACCVRGSAGICVGAFRAQAIGLPFEEAIF